MHHLRLDTSTHKVLFALSVLPDKHSGLDANRNLRGWDIDIWLQSFYYHCCRWTLQSQRSYGWQMFERSELFYGY